MYSKLHHSNFNKCWLLGQVWSYHHSLELPLPSNNVSRVVLSGRTNNYAVFLCNGHAIVHRWRQ